MSSMLSQVVNYKVTLSTRTGESDCIKGLYKCLEFVYQVAKRREGRHLHSREFYTQFQNHPPRLQRRKHIHWQIDELKNSSYKGLEFVYQVAKRREGRHLHSKEFYTQFQNHPPRLQRRKHIHWQIEEFIQLPNTPQCQPKKGVLFYPFLLNSYMTMIFDFLYKNNLNQLVCIFT